MAIHSVVAGIFQPGSKWLTNQHCHPWRPASSVCSAKTRLPRNNVEVTLDNPQAGTISTKKLIYSVIVCSTLPPEVRKLFFFVFWGNLSFKLSFCWLWFSVRSYFDSQAHSVLSLYLPVFICLHQNEIMTIADWFIKGCQHHSLRLTLSLGWIMTVSHHSGVSCAHCISVVFLCCEALLIRKLLYISIISNIIIKKKTGFFWEQTNVKHVTQPGFTVVLMMKL